MDVVNIFLVLIFALLGFFLYSCPPLSPTSAKPSPSPGSPYSIYFLDGRFLAGWVL
jgi:hypothetical protein